VLINNIIDATIVCQLSKEHNNSYLDKTVY